MKVLISDTSRLLPSSADLSIIWGSNCSSLNTINIDQIVDLFSDQCKDEYLEALSSFRKRVFATIDSSILFSNSFSLWWISSLEEKCNFSKLVNADNLIRLFALKYFLEKRPITHLSLCISDKRLAYSLTLLAQSLNIVVEPLFNPSGFQSLPLKPLLFFGNLFSKSIYLSRSIYTFLHYCFRFYRVSRLLSFNKNLLAHARLIFVDYCTGFSLVDNKYNSIYWGSLPNLVNDSPHNSLWVHLLLSKSTFKSNDELKATLNLLNTSDSQQHIVLESFFHPYHFAISLVTWSFILFKYFIGLLIQKKEPFYYDIFLNQQLAEFVFSSELPLTIVRHYSFKRLFSYLDNVDKLVYLQENQPWEMSLLHHWRVSFPNGHSYGIPHSTVRYWDLRYVKNDFDSHFNPSPDYIALNGKLAEKNLSHYPSQTIPIRLEALRYQHLHAQNVCASPKSTITILGDYRYADTRYLLEVISASALYTHKTFKFVFKPHPLCSLSPEEFPNLSYISTTNSDLSTLFSDSLFVVSSSSTSASVEAYCYGLPVVVILNPKFLNLSPLRSLPNCYFASSVAEINNNFDLLFDNKFPLRSPDKDLFYINPSLPLWSKFLSSTIYKC